MSFSEIETELNKITDITSSSISLDMSAITPAERETLDTLSDNVVKLMEFKIGAGKKQSQKHKHKNGRFYVIRIGRRGGKSITVEGKKIYIK